MRIRAESRRGGSGLPGPGRAGRNRRRLGAAAVAALLLAAPMSPAAAQEGPAGGDPGAGAAARAAAPASQEPLRLGVEEAVRWAVTRNEDVLIARAEGARTEGIAKDVRSRSLPDVRFNVGYTRNIQRPVLFFNTPEGVQQISIGNDNDYTFGLTLEQPIVDFSLGPARTAARLSRDATKASVEATRTDVARRARVDYYTVLLDEALVEVQEKALEQAETRLAQVESFFEAGTASEFDLLTARVEVENIRPRLIEARNRLELDRNRFKRTVGIPLDRPVALTDSLRPPGEIPSLEEAVAEAREERRDLRSQEIRVGLQRENLVSESRSVFPTLNFTANFNRRASSDNITPPPRDFTQSASAGLSLSFPIFDGRSRSGRVQQAEAELERERFRLRRLREEIRLQVQQAHQSLVSARQQIEASASNVRRAERALEIAQARFRNGLSTQVELNDAELAVTEARTNYAQSLYNYNVARAELTAATGGR